MRLTNALGIPLLALVIGSLMVSSCQATIEKDYIEFEGTRFRLKFKAIVETEIDGTWDTAKTYEVYIFATLTYWNVSEITGLFVNQSLVDSSGGTNTFDSDSGYLGLYYYIGQTLHHRFWLNVSSTVKDVRTKLSLSFTYVYTEKSSHQMISSSWEMQEPIYIDIEPNGAAGEIVPSIDSLKDQIAAVQNLMYILIAVAVVLVVATCYVAARRPSHPP